MRQRLGRPGLLGLAARTAVFTATSTAVSNRMQRGAAERQAQQQAAAAQQQYQAPPAAPADADSRIAQLQALAELKAQGLLTEAEFAAEKARVLGG